MNKDFLKKAAISAVVFLAVSAAAKRMPGVNKYL